MAFDKNSNSFTFLFATILVTVVGTLLAVTYIGLKPAYEENVRREKMQNILASMNVRVERDAAPAKYEELISETFLVNGEGKPVEGDAFSLDVLKQYKDWKAGVLELDQLKYPVYKATGSEGQVYILPMVGTGLWGPVWGYVSVKKDGRTVYGSTFDHKGETPGLGAEIATPMFQDQFAGKTITEENGTYTGIKVYKGGTGTTDPHGVDGISGGTITSDGVGEMLMRTLAVYDVFLKSTTNSTAAR
ncbi:MAG: NADH:ubiquinone reductase (Na(+)-transporting) subunit C [Flavobacteriales bacterium]|jgi:Na+-transporting NADH:ubiquinone oxidoreductase subunit C|nr:NADH:ubiquinone reductase (Na(+)-transporting) subunit C [Flavobacteriales bacterium]MBK6549622.1 NADH:ubiquinone reductase (Na(+)-transporting) subunit C [Flavobacteriales bacterium]MBK6884349.1 NADH:ubiquinone reductase (Na(+)-transporting) subunit C [Flavobacteriales bacterium]MBK7100744.1 NADH:ubiquinone reductase (Na(+)-transporting) subunit C [Flavobacteriales bacterium]MBK7111434.1 NADH:ubiquinone reductase (Na(+)-transporting) subunit C [Flavobacteriales bacterium]